MRFLVTLLWVTVVGTAGDATLAAAVGHSPVRALTVSSDTAGGVRAVAMLLFPAPPAVVQALLTDYQKWPELFEVRMRVAGIERRDGGVVTDLYIAHALMPGERRLVCESRPLPEGGLVTELKSGDFRRYHRVWQLRPAEDGAWTEAEFELIVELDTLVPDWVIAMTMRRELEAHFRILNEHLLASARPDR